MTQMRPAPQILFDFLREHEKTVLRVYDDARPKAILKRGDKVEGTLTAGTGHTGSDVWIGLKVTPIMADDWLRDDVQRKAVEPLAKKVKASVIATLTEFQYAALLSFVFNLGTGDAYVKGVFVPSKWSIWKVLNAGRLDAVPTEMARFNRMRLKKGGPLVVVEGLVNRRAAEIALWSTPVEPVKEAPAAPTSNEVRAADTPPAPAHVDAKPLAAGVGAAIAAGPAVVNQVRETLQPYADASEIVQKVLSTLAVIGATLAVASLVWMWMQRRRA